MAEGWCELSGFAASVTLEDRRYQKAHHPLSKLGIPLSMI
jgi:hypothetical protein